MEKLSLATIVVAVKSALTRAVNELTSLLDGLCQQAGLPAWMAKPAAIGIVFGVSAGAVQGLGAILALVPGVNVILDVVGNAVQMILGQVAFFAIVFIAGKKAVDVIRSRQAQAEQDDGGAGADTAN